jgi:hypothetical protein
MGAKRNTPRSGGAGIAVTLAAIVFSLIALGTIVGCSGHNDPVSPDQSGVLCRWGQAFSEPEEWGTAYSLDSSTSRWMSPAGGNYVGDIASEDGSTDPLVTAFVRHDSPSSGMIDLVLRDRNWSVVLDEDFSYPPATGQGYTCCRHPAVEVTYHKPQGQNGQLAVHIVWAELIGVHPNEQWDIIYRYIRLDPSTWGVIGQQFVNVSDVSWSDEIQPDLCVDEYSGDLYAAYRAEVAGPTRYAIYAVNLPYANPWNPNGWVSAGTVARLDPTEKAFPSIDAGYFSPLGGPQEYAWQVAVVWSQMDDGYYHIFYNGWDSGDLANRDDAIRISPDIDVGALVLPKIEVLPYSSELHEAVMACGWECWNQSCPPSMNVWMAVTPFIGSGYYDRLYHLDVDSGDLNKRPDLAAYQGEHEGFEDQGLIALSRQCADVSLGTDHFGIVVTAYSVQVDYDPEEETYDFDYRQHTVVDCGDPQPIEISPFTGPSICLRNPDDQDWIYHTFGLAYIDEEDDYMSYLAEGDTIQ